MNEPRKKRELSWLGVGVISALMLLVFLAAVFIPSFVGHQRSPHVPCFSNLKMLQGAKDTWALENNRTTNEAPTDADLFGEASYIREKPTCPLGGTYTLGATGKKPRCSIYGHTI